MILFSERQNFIVMKLYTFILFFLCFGIQLAFADVEYRITLDSDGQTYRVAMRSTVDYSGPFARISPGSQISVVAPDPDGTGPNTFMPTNLTALTALNWSVSQINSPAENPSADYLFFIPANSASYTPFNITANTWIDLFTFQSGTGCEGSLALYENGSDPLDANVTINADQYMAILGGGLTNLWVANAGGPAVCTFDYTVTPLNLTIDEGMTGSFTVVLDNQPASDVVFTIASNDAGAASVDLTMLTFTPANWDTPQTITVTGEQDADINDESVTITVAVDDVNSDDNFDPLPDTIVAVIVNDDDTACNAAAGTISNIQN